MSKINNPVLGLINELSRCPINRSTVETLIDTNPGLNLSEANSSGMNAIKAVIMNGSALDVQFIISAGAIPTEAELKFAQVSYPFKLGTIKVLKTHLLKMKLDAGLKKSSVIGNKPFKA